MVSSPITSNNATGTPSPTSNKLQLKTEDFIKMMITQLQQQDPMQPAKNEELLGQMSQIAQLQSNTSLQSSLSGIVKQNQIGSAAGLIGRKVEGLDASDDPVDGMVTSIRVEGDKVNLELDSGKSLELGRVTTIAPLVAGAASTAAPAN